MTQGSISHRFRRTLLGYRKREVDDAVGALSAQLQEAQHASDLGALVGRHLGGLLTRFAEAVDQGERDAEAAAESVIEDAEARAAATELRARQVLADAQAEAAAAFEEARRHYEAHLAVRRTAMTQLEEALGQVRDAVSVLSAVPEFPAVPSALAVSPVVDVTTEPAADTADAEPEASDLVA